MVRAHASDYMADLTSVLYTPMLLITPNGLTKSNTVILDILPLKEV